MTKLSVNINKIATIRNSRKEGYPSVIEAAIKIQQFGANGITIHPRPDERHITQQDAIDLSKVVYKEYNIEGNPTEKFIELIKKIIPTQVTLVPDKENAITSSYGWDIKKYKNYLKDIVSELRNLNIRSSIFLSPNPKDIELCAEIKCDRIELYTKYYADSFKNNKVLEAINKYKICFDIANQNQIAVNAGHDLNLDNIYFLIHNIPSIKEVSIGHALISESLYMGLENTIQAYIEKIKRAKNTY